MNQFKNGQYPFHNLLPNKEANVKGVEKLLRDIYDNVWAFQAESSEEHENIEIGLALIMKDLKQTYL